MKRATITIPDDLETELKAFLKTLDTPPSMTTIMQSALRSYLVDQKLKARGFRPAEKPFQLPVAEQGSGKKDIGSNHDKYL